MKLILLIKICLNQTCSYVHIGKYLSDAFLIQNSQKVLIMTTLKYSIKMGLENQEGLKVSGTYQLQVSADDVNLLGTNINITE